MIHLYEENLQNRLKDILEIGDTPAFSRALDNLSIPGPKGNYDKLFHIICDRKMGGSQWGCAGQVEFPQYDGPPTYDIVTRELALGVLSRKIKMDFDNLIFTLSQEGASLQKESMLFLAARLEEIAGRLKT